MSTRAGSAAEPFAGADDAPYYVYGVARSGLVADALEDVEGIGERGPTLVDHEGLVAVVEVLDDAAAVGARRGLMAHYRVLNAIAGHAVVLPMRFGTVVDGLVAVRSLVLRSQREELEAALDALTGHVQVVVKARYVQEAVLAEVISADPRIRELNELTRDAPEDALHHQRIRLGELVAHAIDSRRATDRQLLLGALAPLAADWSVRDGAGVDGLADVSLLVPEQQRAALEEAATNLARSWAQRVTLRLLGPMAPFDFVPAG